VAFWKGRSTHLHIITLRNVIEEALSKNQPLHVVFVDLEKAYDSLPHLAITTTLQYYGTMPELQNLISKLYTGAHATVSTRYGNTEPLPINKGVKQGDPLSPLLWNLFINPIVGQLLSKESVLTTTHGEKIGNTAFIDNITILSNTGPGLVKSFSLFQDFCNYHNLQISLSKFIVATTTNTPATIVVNTMAGMQLIPHLKPRDSVKYLGAHIWFNKFKQNKSAIIKSFTQKANFIASKWLSAEAKAFFINTYTFPAALYNTPSHLLTQKSINAIDCAACKVLL
jgi:hypothetical protein